MLILKILLLVISPVLLLCLWIGLRLLYSIILYKLYKRQLQDLPRALDPFIRIKGYAFADPTIPLGEENKRLAGKGKAYLPIVFLGPYLDMGRPVVMINDPELIHEACDETIFVKYPPHCETLSDAFGLGLPADTGARWQKHRIIINPLFHVNRLQMFTKRMTAGADELVEEVRKANGKEIQCYDLLSQATLRVLIDCLFNREDLEPKWTSQMITSTVSSFGTNGLGKLILGSTLNRLSPASRLIRDNKAKIFEKIMNICEKARSHPVDEDNANLVELLVAQKDENGKQALTDYEIAEESFMMLFAGHDTTQSALGWALYYLCQDRKLMEQLQQEVERELKGRTATYEDLPNLQHCKYAIMESLRLRGPAAFLHRTIKEPRYLGGQYLPKQTTIMLNLHAAHTDPTLWENPDVYNPDRFISAAGYSKHYFPFAYGMRNCVGQKFAMNEAVILLSALIQNFEIYIGSTPVKAQLRVTIQPVGLHCKFIPRVK